MKKLKYVAGYTLFIAIGLAVSFMLHRAYRDSRVETLIAKCQGAYPVLRDAIDRYTADKKVRPTLIQELERAGYLKEGTYPAECRPSRIPAPPIGIDDPRPERRDPPPTDRGRV